MLYEADEFKMDFFAMELNKFLDTILEVVYKYAGTRSLFFTSFSPEVCMMLATKQTTYPILFLNESSKWPTGDSRALSIQTAVHFARKWGLQGVVMESQPFVDAPKLIQFVRDQGLYTSSYGEQNDDPELAKVRYIKFAGSSYCVLADLGCLADPSEREPGFHHCE
jgi:glycerophosphodiester phosphodiesterase